MSFFTISKNLSCLENTILKELKHPALTVLLCLVTYHARNGK